MKNETHNLLQKYRYMYVMLHNERYDLFQKIIFDNSMNNYIQLFDGEEYIKFIFYVELKHSQIMKYWHDYNSYTGRIIKKFEKRRTILKREAYQTILRPYFCRDLCFEIVSYIV